MKGKASKEAFKRRTPAEAISYPGIGGFRKDNATPEKRPFVVDNSAVA